ncbi:MAG: hypothetical protein ABSG41_27885 [Bryobacteraceae bacterium]
MDPGVKIIVLPAVIIDRGFTPDMLAGIMWSHAPAMQGCMQAKQISWPRFDTREMSDSSLI